MELDGARIKKVTHTYKESGSGKAYESWWETQIVLVSDSVSLNTLDELTNAQVAQNSAEAAPRGIQLLLVPW